MIKGLKITGLILLAFGVFYVLIAANKMIEEQEMQAPLIHLDIQDEIPLITEEEILRELEIKELYYPNILKTDLKLGEIEAYLLQTNEVLTADVYTGLTSKWHIYVKTKRPIVRVMSLQLNDFYINKDYNVMRLSPYYKPKVLVVTGVDALVEKGITYDEIINNDSLKTKLKLDQIYRISTYVCNDSFYNAQIVQLHYSKKEGFILIPRVGLQKIIFGDALSDRMVEEKFRKLTTFYNEVIPYEGWNKYNTINLKFKDQIVAKKN